MEGPLCKSLTPHHHVGHTKGLSVCNDSGKGWAGKPRSALGSLLVSYCFLPAQTVTLKAEKRVGRVSRGVGGTAGRSLWSLALASRIRPRDCLPADARDKAGSIPMPCARPRTLGIHASNGLAWLPRAWPWEEKGPYAL